MLSLSIGHLRTVLRQHVPEENLLQTVRGMAMEYLPQGPHIPDAALDQYAEAVTQFLGHVHYMGRDQNCPALISLLSKEVRDRLGCDDVQAAGRFIENDDLGIVNEAYCDGGLLLHAGGEGADGAVPSLAQADPETRYQFERLGYFCPDAADDSAAARVFNRVVTLRDSWAKIEQQAMQAEN